MKEAHLAINLNPDSDMAHFCLANSLRLQEDWAGAAAEVLQDLAVESEV